MIHPAPLLVLCVLACAACRKPPEEVIITETRPITTRDTPAKLDATSDERFRDTRPSPIQGETPAGWLAKPATQMRLLNYTFGESGMGEVYVGLSQGTKLDNVNRWLNEFASPPIDPTALSNLPSTPCAGTSGVLLTATGTYSPGRGIPPREGFGLAGIIAEADGNILTIKMIGPESEVRAAMSALTGFAASLKWNPSRSGQ